MSFNTIGPLAPALGQHVSEGFEKEKASPTGGFADYLGKAVGDVNNLLSDSDRKSVDMAVGKSENLHSAMISFEKAETALKLLVQVRNKAMDAYHEIMRMQA